MHITFAALHDLDKQLTEVASTDVSLNAEYFFKNISAALSMIHDG